MASCFLNHCQIDSVNVTAVLKVLCNCPQQQNKGNRVYWMFKVTRKTAAIMDKDNLSYFGCQLRLLDHEMHARS